MGPPPSRKRRSHIDHDMKSTIAFTTAAFLGIAVTTSWSAKPDSPLSWRTVSETPALDVSAARGRAATYLGVPDAQAVSYEVGRITDRNELGDPVSDRLAYAFLFPSVPWERNFEGRVDAGQVDLQVVVDARTGELILAFTPARSEWVERDNSPFRPLNDVAEENGWTLLPAAVPDLRSTIADVLQAAFAQYAPMIAEAGQIVIRPRWVEQKFPARLDGEILVPLRSPGLGWIVHTMGSVVGHSSPPPLPSKACGDSTGAPLREPSAYTQTLILVADLSLQIERTVLIP